MRRRPIQHQQQPTYPWQVFAQVDTNAGIPYIVPFQPPFFRGNRLPVHEHPTFFGVLIPETLPPEISGMAWWRPFDQPDQRKTKTFIQQTEMVLLIPDTLPVPISGSAWNVAWTPPHFPHRTKPNAHQFSPAFVSVEGAPVGISGMAWFQPFTPPKQRKTDVWTMSSPTTTYKLPPWKGYYTVRIFGGIR